MKRQFVRCLIRILSTVREQLDEARYEDSENAESYSKIKKQISVAREGLYDIYERKELD